LRERRGDEGGYAQDDAEGLYAQKGQEVGRGRARGLREGRGNEVMSEDAQRVRARVLEEDGGGGRGGGRGEWGGEGEEEERRGEEQDEEGEEGVQKRRSNGGLFTHRGRFRSLLQEEEQEGEAGGTGRERKGEGGRGTGTKRVGSGLSYRRKSKKARQGGGGRQGQGQGLRRMGRGGRGGGGGGGGGWVPRGARAGRDTAGSASASGTAPPPLALSTPAQTHRGTGPRSGKLPQGEGRGGGSRGAKQRLGTRRGLVPPPSQEEASFSGGEASSSRGSLGEGFSGFGSFEEFRLLVAQPRGEGGPLAFAPVGAGPHHPA